MKAIAASIRGFFKTMDLFSMAVLCLSVAGFLCLAMAQVICRYIFNSSLSWSDQACRYLFCVTTFMGAAICVREQGHITIDILAEILPKRHLKYQAVGVSVFIFALSILLIVTGWQLAVRNLGQDTTTLPLTMGSIYMMIPISAAIMAINAVRVICDNVMMIVRGEEAPAAAGQQA